MSEHLNTSSDETETGDSSPQPRRVSVQASMLHSAGIGREAPKAPAVPLRLEAGFAAALHEQRRRAESAADRHHEEEDDDDAESEEANARRLSRIPVQRSLPSSESDRHSVPEDNLPARETSEQEVMDDEFGSTDQIVEIDLGNVNIAAEAREPQALDPTVEQLEEMQAGSYVELPLHGMPAVETEPAAAEEPEITPSHAPSASESILPPPGALSAEAAPAGLSEDEPTAPTAASASRPYSATGSARNTIPSPPPGPPPHGPNRNTGPGFNAPPPPGGNYNAPPPEPPMPPAPPWANRPGGGPGGGGNFFNRLSQPISPNRLADINSRLNVLELHHYHGDVLARVIAGWALVRTFGNRKRIRENAKSTQKQFERQAQTIDNLTQRNDSLQQRLNQFERQAASAPAQPNRFRPAGNVEVPRSPAANPNSLNHQPNGAERAPQLQARQEAAVRQEGLEVPPEHEVVRSQWLSIERDKKTGEVVEQPTSFEYGAAYHAERRSEQLQDRTLNGTQGTQSGGQPGLGGFFGIDSHGYGQQGAPSPTSPPAPPPTSKKELARSAGQQLAAATTNPWLWVGIIFLLIVFFAAAWF